MFEARSDFEVTFDGCVCLENLKHMKPTLKGFLILLERSNYQMLVKNEAGQEANPEGIPDDLAGFLADFPCF